MGSYLVLLMDVDYQEYKCLLQVQEYLVDGYKKINKIISYDDILLNNYNFFYLKKFYSSTSLLPK